MEEIELGNGKPPWRAIAMMAGFLCAGLLIGFIVSDYAFMLVNQPDPADRAIIQPAEQLEMIADVWDEIPPGERTRSGDCPTVRALNGWLHQIAPIDARQRDYVAFLRGVRC